VPLLDRVVHDTSALLGRHSSALIAGAALGYYSAFWSPWVISEFARVRTEWVAERAARQGYTAAEVRLRLRESRQRVNALVAHLSRVFSVVNHTDAPPADLSWLRDRDDWPLMQTALAAGADTLVTDDAADFPLGEERNGIFILNSEAFLQALYVKFPGGAMATEEYLREGRR